MLYDDAELARLIQKGSEDAFEQLVRQYGGLIKAIVNFHLKDIEYRKDCVNDTLFAVWRNIGRFDPAKSSLKNWIAAVAKYRAIDCKRKYYRELCEELDENTMEGREDPALLRCELREETDALLKNLSPYDREIFEKRYLMDISVEEIAVSKGKTAAYIYNRLSRGRKKLRCLFEKGRS